MFLQRALVTLLFGPLALLLIYLGGWFYFLPLTAVLFIATVEYTHIMRRLGWTVSLWVLLPAVALQWAAGQWPAFTWFTPALLFGLAAAMIYGLWLYERQGSRTATADWLAMTGGVVLLGWIGAHFFRLRGLPELAWQWTMVAMLGTWVADSGAYLVGRFLAGKFVFGRHALSPRLSPKKTVEGYVGGIAAATAVVLTLAHFWQLPMGVALLATLLVSAVSPLGDLGISLLKRESGLKDSGNLFPGHGGALDRIDSLMWSATMVYYLILLTG